MIKGDIVLFACKLTWKGHMSIYISQKVIAVVTSDTAVLKKSEFSV